MASDRIFIAESSDLSEVYRWQDGRLIQLSIERPGAGSRVGGLYLGRVVALEPSLNAAFLDIGAEKPGFLPLKRKGASLGEGEQILVQVRRDGYEGKGPRLSMAVAQTDDIQRQAAAARAPHCLIQPPSPWQRMLTACNPSTVGAIICDRRVDVQTVTDWCRRFAPELAGSVQHLPRRDWVPDNAELAEAVAAALESEVPLPSGGTLLIEPVRTLTAIDVNSATATDRRGIEQTALSVNLEAAQEIPYQLCLRNIGGIIVIDFIDLENRQKRDRVIEALREAVGIDPAIEWVGNMSRLCLVEVLRRRTGPSLPAMWALYKDAQG